MDERNIEPYNEGWMMRILRTKLATAESHTAPSMQQTEWVRYAKGAVVVVAACVAGIAFILNGYFAAYFVCWACEIAIAGYLGLRCVASSWERTYRAAQHESAASMPATQPSDTLRPVRRSTADADAMLDAAKDIELSSDAELEEALRAAGMLT